MNKKKIIDKIKTEFIANAAHELRTPLAIMRGNVDLALSDKNIKSATTSLKVIKNEIAHLSALITDLATLTSHNRHEKKVASSSPVNIIMLINLTVKRLSVLLRKKKIKVKISNGKLKEILIDGDRQSLEKLFVNLLRNAITYGKEGGHIFINIKKVKNEAVVIVEDDGIGISKKDLPYIFERFYRAEEARIMTSIGTGLGLAIAKWAAESHGGTITAKSIEGEGSVFTVTLPIKK